MRMNVKMNLKPAIMEMDISVMVCVCMYMHVCTSIMTYSVV